MVFTHDTETALAFTAALINTGRQSEEGLPDVVISLSTYQSTCAAPARGGVLCWGPSGSSQMPAIGGVVRHGQITVRQASGSYKAKRPLLISGPCPGKFFVRLKQPLCPGCAPHFDIAG